MVDRPGWPGESQWDFNPDPLASVRRLGTLVPQWTAQGAWFRCLPRCWFVLGSLIELTRRVPRLMPICQCPSCRRSASAAATPGYWRCDGPATQIGPGQPRPGRQQVYWGCGMCPQYTCCAQGPLATLAHYAPMGSPQDASAPAQHARPAAFNAQALQIVTPSAGARRGHLDPHAAMWPLARAAHHRSQSLHPRKCYGRASSRRLKWAFVKRGTLRRAGYGHYRRGSAHKS